MNQAATATGKSRWELHSSAVILSLTVLMLAAAWLRFHQLSMHGLWLDEACSVLYAHLPPGKFWKLMWKQEGNMLLYYLLLRGWVHVGDTELMVRLPSILFGVASIPMIYLLGRDLFGKATGLIAAALLTVHWFHIFFSQEARAYTLLIFLLLLSSWLFFRWTESPGRKRYRYAYPVVSALAMYAHLFAILVVAAQWLSLGRGRARRIGGRHSLSVVAAFVVLALPMEAFALLRNKGQLIWVPPVTLKAFVEAMSAIAGYDNGLLSLILLRLGLAVIAIIAGCRYGSEKAAFSVRLLALWTLVPIAATLLYSLHRPLFYSRFLVICVPPLLLLTAEGLAIIKRAPTPFRWFWVPTLVLMLAMSLRATSHYYQAPMWPDWNSATQLIRVNELPGDGVCFAGNGVEPFFYYLQRQTKIAWDSLPIVQRSYGFKCLTLSPRKLSEAGSEYHRIWLITTDPSQQEKDWIKENLVPRYGQPMTRGLFRGPIKLELLPGAADE